MRQLTHNKECIFTPKLYEIMIPDKVMNDIEKIEYIFLVMEY